MKIILCYYITILVYLSIDCSMFSKLKSNDKDDPLANMSDDQIKQEMKKYGITDAELSLLGKEDKSNTKAKKSKAASIIGIDKSPNDDTSYVQSNIQALKNFNLSTKDAEKLINFLKNFTIFNQLPVTAMNIVSNSSKSVDDNSYFNTFNNILISNTLNSQVFIDSENKVGRKGMLTLINTKQSQKDSYQQVWAIVNSKVVALYNSHKYLNIISIFRIANLKLVSPPFSPCFMLMNRLSVKEKELICALNFREKKYWIDTLNYHIKSYTDYTIKK